MSLCRGLLKSTIGCLASLVLSASCAPRETTPDDAADQTPDETRRYSAEISHSKGVPGGIVLLWPRVVPMAETAAMRGPAKALQDRLKAMLMEHFPGRPIDVRPEPERVCPKLGGCDASSVGVLIGVREGGCVAVVIVSKPGMSNQELMPWAGLMSTKMFVPFREPPESSIQLEEMVPCDKLAIATLEREDRVKDALKDAQ